MPSAPIEGDACVIPEPTDRRVVTAAAGALTFRLEVRGRAAHGSSRAEGVSALEAFLPVHAALRELERERCADPDPLMAGYRLAYPLSDSRRGIPTRCHVTGPSCDSQDTILFDTALSADLTCGDRVYIGSAGAYTTAYASRFNGFDVPRVRCVGPRDSAAPVPGVLPAVPMGSERT